MKQPYNKVFFSFWAYELLQNKSYPAHFYRGGLHSHPSGTCSRLLTSLRASPELDSFTSECFSFKNESLKSERWHCRVSFSSQFRRNQGGKKNNRRGQLANETLPAHWPTSLLITNVKFILPHTRDPYGLPTGKKGEEPYLCRLRGLSVTGTALISRLSAQPRDGVAVFLHVKPTCERFAHPKYYVNTVSLL